MDELRRYCDAQHQLSLSKREERERTSDMCGRRVLALETLDAGLRAAGLECCETTVGADRLFVCAKYANRARKPSVGELHGLIDKLQTPPEGIDAAGHVSDALCSPFRTTTRNGVSVGKKCAADLTPAPLPAHLVPFVETYVATSAAIATVRKAMREPRKAARKVCKETRDAAMGAARASDTAVVVRAGRGDYHARITTTEKKKSVTLRGLEEVTHRVADECAANDVDALRATLKRAVNEAFDDEDVTTVERLRYAVS